MMVAKAFHVKVDEFGLGFPPRLIKLFTWGSTDFTLNALPLGGFVRMAEDDPASPGSLASKKPLVRALVLVAGPLTNLILAILLLSVTFMAGTLEPYDGPGAGVYGVSLRSPAEAAGIAPGDNIISIDGQTIETADQVSQIVQQRLGQEVTLVVTRNGEELAPIKLVPRTGPPPGEGAIGIAVDLPLKIVKYPIWEAIPLGAKTSYLMMRNLFRTIAAAFRKEVAFEVTGVIGMYRMTKQVAQTGLIRLLEFAGFLSVNFALLNIMPIPALDGGRLIFALLEWIRGGQKIPPEKEGLVHLVGMVLLVALMVAVAVLDYNRYFR